MQIVVLAGGLAPPAWPDAPPSPESLLVTNGRPLIDWQLDRFVASGARSVVVCLGQGGEQIETHVRRALDRGLTVGYSYPAEQALGTGGSLRRAFARLDSEFVLTYGDRYLPFDYAAPLHDLREHPAAAATMSVRRERSNGGGSLALDGDWVTKYEATAGAGLDCSDYGAIALRRSALEGIEDGAVWGIEALFRRLARQHQLRGFVAPERSYRAGSPDDLLELAQHLASQPHDD